MTRDEFIAEYKRLRAENDANWEKSKEIHEKVDRLWEEHGRKYFDLKKGDTFEIRGTTYEVLLVEPEDREFVIINARQKD